MIVRDLSLAGMVNETGDRSRRLGRANRQSGYEVLQSNCPAGRRRLSASEPRLYFDLPSSVSANGPSKTLVPDESTQTIEFSISIFPDRDAVDESHVLNIRYLDAFGRVRETAIDVHVIDQDLDRPLEFNIIADFRYDETGFFDDPAAREAVRLAADDFTYFIADMKLDEVRAGNEELMWVNEPREWGRGKHVSNLVAYTGFLMNVYGFYEMQDVSNGSVGPGGSGGPSPRGHNQSARGRELPIKRSGSIVINPLGNYDSIGWLTSVDDEDWWYAEAGNNLEADLYSVALHEIGHAIVFNGGHLLFNGFKKARELRAPGMTKYYGSNPQLDRFEHFFDSVDPASRRGAFGNEYGREMAGGRWLVTKFDLLVAQATGYVLRDTSPFRELSLPDSGLAEGNFGDEYAHTMNVVGGIPAYNWAIDSGTLPQGLSLDSFTGTISGIPAETGSFEFEVKVCDSYEGSPCVVRQATLVIGSRS